MSVAERMDRLQHATLSDRVYRDLRELLMAGQVAPGEKLNPRAIAHALGTSAMPVREALRRLMAEQAVEFLPNTAIRVPVMTASRFREVRTIRVILEGMATETAAQSITPAELAEAERHAQAFLDAPSDAPEEIIRANKDLHFTIYRAARMPVLLQIIESLWTQVGPVINLDIRSGSERIKQRLARRHHTAMLEGLARGDGGAARAALAADIMDAGDSILAQGGLPP
jgi:DNA-binding GntR family transcriptional regulator